MKAVDKKSGYITRSVLCAPIFHDDGSVIAVAQIINKFPLGNPFEKDDIHLLEDFAVHISLAFSRVKALEHGHDNHPVMSFNSSDFLQSKKSSGRSRKKRSRVEEVEAEE